MLTVVIPVLDGGPLLDRQLDALLASPAPDGLEVVVADDGSTDGTQERVLARAGSDPRLRLVPAGAARGVSAARNRATAAARNPAVAYCDADDVVAPGWAAAMAAALRAAPYVAGRLEHDRLNPGWAADVRGRPLERSLTKSRGGTGWEYAFGCNLGVRREVWEAAGGFDERLVGGGDDDDFSWRLRRLGVRPTWAPDAVVHYRCRSDLAGIWRQARGYGAARVRLSRIWPELWHEPGPDGLPPTTPPWPLPTPEQSVERLRRRAGWAVRVRGRTGLGKVFWRDGWLAGVRAEHAAAWPFEATAPAAPAPALVIPRQPAARETVEAPAAV